MKIIRVLSGGAAQGLVEALQPSFEAGTGCRIDGVFGAVGAMKSRLLAGEPVDILILSRTLIDGLARDGHVVGQSAKDIGAVQTAIAVRSGSFSARRWPMTQTSNASLRRGRRAGTDSAD